MTFKKKRVNIITTKSWKTKTQKTVINIFLTKMDKSCCEKHIPVLLNELTTSLKIYNNKQNIIVDCTLWMWWHAREIISKLNPWDIFIWFDADIKNLEVASLKLKNEFRNSKIDMFFINDNFVNLNSNLSKLNLWKITWIYYDFWLSSLHIDEAERWFSYRLDWPLDMRFDKTNKIKASDIINSYKIQDLIKIFTNYWEEPNSKKIAEKIVEKRKLWKKFLKTKDLVEVIDEVSLNIKTKTKIFQAIRIETNNELENIKKSLNQAIDLLDKWWNIFVISFHSLEDRIVKNIFRDESKDCICKDLICSCKHKAKLKILTKKPIIPDKSEIKENKRARSAKARLAVKI